MRTLIVWSLVALTILTVGGEQAGFAQTGGAVVGYRNETSVPVIIQGVSKVNNMPRRGQPILVPPGKKAFDINIPPGVRFVNIYDAQQPSRVLLANFPVSIEVLELAIVVRPSPTHRDRVILMPDTTPP